MKAFLAGLVAAIVIAVGSYVYFDAVVQQSAGQAYTTKSVRI